MWFRVLFLVYLIPGFVVAESEKTFSFVGTTWNSMSSGDNRPETINVKEDLQGRILRISTVVAEEMTDDRVIYSSNRCQLSFESSGIITNMNISWVEQEKDTYKITFGQQNQVPKQVVGGVTHPAVVLNKTLKITLKVTNPQQYSWIETGSDQGDLQYDCYSGQKLVMTGYDAGLNQNFVKVLDGHSSDSGPTGTLRIVYSKKGGHVVGKQSWKNDARDTAWFDGGSFEYSGDSLSTPHPITNVVNYYILTVFFSSATWGYFAPSLFSIPIR